MTNEDYKALAPSLPKQPGVYQYMGEDGSILYVGKAKNLKNRIASYFGEKKHSSYKTRVMIKNADHLSYTIVESEQDALLLENTLIKKYQPRYNVMLKDDKSYTYIIIKKERFPRVFITRRVIKDGSNYYGPYTSKWRISQILEIIKNLFPLRTCNYDLKQSNIEKGKFKVCLEYHIKNCIGPCVGYESEEEYNVRITMIKHILRGNFGMVKSHLKTQMKLHAEALEFEKAEVFKNKLSLFEDYQSKSTVVSTQIKDVDVVSFDEMDKMAYVNYLKVINGAIINAYTLEMKKNLNDDKEALLSFATTTLREKYNSISPEIIVPFLFPIADENIKQTIPTRGDKKKLLELSQKNVTYFKMQKKKDAINKSNKMGHTERILKTLQSDLQMKEVPLHIECFDNSNLQGTHPVASCVVFKNAKPAKKDYRHFNIKTVVGANDFASMEEVVHRRYRRMLDEGTELPQLIIIDGGKGQLSSSVKSLKVLGIEDKVVIIGIAKRLEEIFFPDDPIPIYINKKSESLKLIQQLRNEAHRFAITFHRTKRSENFTKSGLTNIPGVGAKTSAKLLKEFGSITQMKKADPEAITKIVGPKASEKIQKYLAKN